MKKLNEYPDQLRLTEEELNDLQQGKPTVVTYSSPVDIMIGQYSQVELLILPPKETE